MRGTEEQMTADRSMRWLLQTDQPITGSDLGRASRAVIDACDAAGSSYITFRAAKGKGVLSVTDEGIRSSGYLVTELRDNQLWLCPKCVRTYKGDRTKNRPCRCFPATLLVEDHYSIVNEKTSLSLRQLDVLYQQSTDDWESHAQSTSDRVRRLCETAGIPVLELKRRDGLLIAFSRTWHGREEAEKLDGDWCAPDGYEWWCTECCVGVRWRTGGGDNKRPPNWRSNCYDRAVLR